jgi:hypothetical protein
MFSTSGGALSCAGTAVRAAGGRGVDPGGPALVSAMLVDHHSLVVRPLVPGSHMPTRLWDVHVAGVGVKNNSSWIATALTFLFSVSDDRF